MKCIICFNSFRLCILLFRWIDLLYWCRRVLAENVWLICWNNWLGGHRSNGNDFCRLYLWSWEVQNPLILKVFMIITVIVHRFTEDIFQMTGYRPGPYWQYTWRYIGPVIMVCILVSSVVCMVIQNPTYSAWNAAEVRIQMMFFWWH